MRVPKSTAVDLGSLTAGCFGRDGMAFWGLLVTTLDGAWLSEPFGNDFTFAEVLADQGRILEHLH